MKAPGEPGTNRGRYDGVVQILRYNVHYYVGSLCALLFIVILLRLHLLPRLLEAGLGGIAGLAAFWAASSLIVSYYIYDHAAVTGWSWLPEMLPFPPRRWLTIHAGLDEATNSLTRIFPDTGYVVLDIYDRAEMTEPSIARARRMHPCGHPAVRCKLDALPLSDQGRDTLFLLFTAHEIREPARRVVFLREASRTLAAPGQMLVVEHLRDWKNFIAFGPGFFHFYSRREWVRVAREAGLTVERESPVTPFVRCFLMSRSTK
jgi:ubiquinone/menaquinone biosynthesis C-methylase UbiE